MASAFHIRLLVVFLARDCIFGNEFDFDLICLFAVPIAGLRPPLAGPLSKVPSMEKGNHNLHGSLLSFHAVELNLEPPKKPTSISAYIYKYIVYIHVLIYVIAKNVANKNRAGEIHS